MEMTDNLTAPQGATDSSESKVKTPFVEPKLAFIEPRLVKRGSVNEATAQVPLSGSFYGVPV